MKKLGYLVYETCELVYTNCYSVNARSVLSTQCLIMLKDYVIMLNTYVVFSTQCPLRLKGYVIMLKRWVILCTKHVNLSIEFFIVQMGVLLCVHNIVLCQKTILLH